MNRLNSNKKSDKVLGPPRGGQGGQNPPKLLGLAGEKIPKNQQSKKTGNPLTILLARGPSIIE